MLSCGHDKLGNDVCFVCKKPICLHDLWSEGCVYNAFVNLVVSNVWSGKINGGEITHKCCHPKRI